MGGKVSRTNSPRNGTVGLNYPPGTEKTAQKKDVTMSRLAHERTRKRTADRGGKRLRLKNPLIRSYVENKLQDGYSPEQIAGRLKNEMPSQKISHEAIYQYIYAQYRRGGYGACFGSDLRQHLRHRHKVRYPKKYPMLCGKRACYE